MPCRHTDIRTFDGLRCCLACGETVFEKRQLQLELPKPFEELTEYKHVPLHTGLGLEIRLIILLPGRQSDPVRCDIIHVLLGGAEFEAVSYTWATEDGDDSKSKTIQIGPDRLMHVTVNCEYALRQLRHTQTERRLWVDAICIDQADLSERSHQVGIMDQIFSTADSVIMSIPYMSVDSSDITSLFFWLRNPLDLGCQNQWMDSNFPKVWNALKVLLTSRYFQRAWVIQEIALARRLRLSYNMFEADIFFPVLYNIRQEFQSPPALDWTPGLARQSDVMSCLRAGFKCQARDVRDKVFAVLSLMEPSVRSLIPADYSLCELSVYCHALIAVVVSLQNLDILTYIAWRNTKRPRSLSTAFLERKDFEEFVLKNGSHKQYTANSLHENFHPWKARTDVKILQKRKSESLTVSSRGDLIVASDQCFVTLPSSLPYYPRANMMPKFHVRAHLIDSIVRERHFHGDEIDWALDIGSFDIQRSRWLFRCFSLSSKLEEDWSGPFEENNHHPPLENWVNRSDLIEFNRSRTDFPWCMLFETHYSVGYVPNVSRDIGFGAPFLCKEDRIFAVDGIPTPLVLRQNTQGDYGIVSACYLWAALELDYWSPGTKKGRWGTRHHDHGCEQTRMITIIGDPGDDRGSGWDCF